MINIISLLYQLSTLSLTMIRYFFFKLCMIDYNENKTVTLKQLLQNNVVNIYFRTRFSLVNSVNSYSSLK